MKLNEFGHPILEETSSSAKVDEFGSPIVEDSKNSTVDEFGSPIVNEKGYYVQKTHDGISYEVPTKEAWEKEQKDSSLTNSAPKLWEGLKGVGESLVKGAGKLVASPARTVKKGYEVGKDYGLQEGIKAAVRSSAGDAVSATAEPFLQGGEFFGQIGKNIGSAVADEFYSKEEEKQREYDRHVEKLAHNARRGAGKTVTGDVVEKLGLNRQVIDENVDQDIAALAGIVVDPSFLVSGGAGAAAKLLMKGGRYVKTAEALKGLEAAAKTNNTLEIDKAKKAVQEAMVSEKNLGDKATDLFEKFNTLDVSPSRLAIKGVEKTASGVENVAGKAVKAGEYMLKEQPALSAVTSGALASPLGAMAAISTAASTYATGKALKAGEAYLEQAGKLGSGIERTRDTLNIAGKVKNLAKGLGESLDAGGTKDGFLRAMNSTNDEVSKDIFAKAAGLNRFTETMSKAKKSEKIVDEAGVEIAQTELKRKGIGLFNESLGTGLKYADKAARNIVDPALKGAAVGGVLNFAADPTAEGFFYGAGAGIGYGLTGSAVKASVDHITKMSDTPINIEQDNKYVKSFSESLPKGQKELFDSANLYGEPMHNLQKAELARTIDLIEGTGLASVKLVNGDEGMEKMLVSMGYSPEQAKELSVNKGFFQPSLDKSEAVTGNKTPLIVVNNSRGDAVTVFHEGAGHVGLRMVNPDADLTPIMETTLKYWGGYKDPITGKFKEGKLTPFLEKQAQQNFNKETQEAVSDEAKRKYIIEEMDADAKEQLMRRAARSGVGVIEYSRQVLKASDEQALKTLQELSGGVQYGVEGNYREAYKRGASRLFYDENGNYMVNSVETEKLIAAQILNTFENKSQSYKGIASDEVKVKIDTGELVKNAQEARQAREVSKKSNDVQEILNSEEMNKTLIASGLYKTRIRDNNEMLNQAEKLAKLINNTETPTPEQEYKAYRKLAREEILFESGGRPLFLTAKEMKQRDFNYNSQIYETLSNIISDDPAAMQMKIGKDGKAYFNGKYLSDEQIKAILDIPDNRLPAHIKENVELMNRSIREKGDGSVFDANYIGALKNGKYNSSATVSVRKFTPTSMNISKGGNFYATSFDISNFNKVIEKQSKDMNSKLYKIFQDPTDKSPNQVMERLVDSVHKYLENHQNDLRGETGLSADEAKAKQRAEYINGLFGMNEATWKNYIANLDSDAVVKKLPNFYRAFRLDRMFNLREAADKNFSITPKHLKENFQTENPEIVNFSIEAHHASPHDFDKFDVSKIGTGEGAQAFGYGLYFAQNKAVTDWYYDAFKVRLRDEVSSASKYLDENIDWQSDVEDIVDNLYDTISENSGKINENDIDQLIDYYYKNEKQYPGYSSNWYDEYSDLFGKEEADNVVESAQDGFKKMLKSMASENKDFFSEIKKAKEEMGNKNEPSRYKVNIDKDETFLKYEEPQSGEIKEILEKNKIPNESGVDTYKYLSKKLGGDKQASEYLDSIGVHGIKYLDGISRRKSENPNYNYVVFNDKNVSILEKISGTKKLETKNKPKFEFPGVFQVIKYRGTYDVYLNDMQTINVEASSVAEAKRKSKEEYQKIMEEKNKDLNFQTESPEINQIENIINIEPTKYGQFQFIMKDGSKHQINASSKEDVIKKLNYNKEDPNSNYNFYFGGKTKTLSDKTDPYVQSIMKQGASEREAAVINDYISEFESDTGNGENHIKEKLLELYNSKEKSEFFKKITDPEHDDLFRVFNNENKSFKVGQKVNSGISSFSKEDIIEKNPVNDQILNIPKGQVTVFKISKPDSKSVKGIDFTKAKNMPNEIVLVPQEFEVVSKKQLSDPKFEWEENPDGSYEEVTIRPTSKMIESENYSIVKSNAHFQTDDQYSSGKPKGIDPISENEMNFMETNQFPENYIQDSKEQKVFREYLNRKIKEKGLNSSVGLYYKLSPKEKVKFENLFKSVRFQTEYNQKKESTPLLKRVDPKIFIVPKGINDEQEIKNLFPR